MSLIQYWAHFYFYKGNLRTLLYINFSKLLLYNNLDNSLKLG